MGVYKLSEGGAFKTRCLLSRLLDVFGNAYSTYFLVLGVGRQRPQVGVCPRRLVLAHLFTSTLQATSVEYVSGEASLTGGGPPAGRTAPSPARLLSTGVSRRASVRGMMVEVVVVDWWCGGGVEETACQGRVYHRLQSSAVIFVLKPSFLKLVRPVDEF